MRSAALRPVISWMVSACVLVVLSAGQTRAWGPHPDITRAALAVLPDAKRWNAALGTENIAALANYSWMPDMRGQDLGAFYADDYLLIRQVPLRNGHGARIVLLDTDYGTLATTSGEPTADGVWKGEFALHHLRPGTYRLLAYRTGSQFSISEPLTLETGKPARLDFTLTATDPAGNVVENPDGRLVYLLPDVPDRWRAVASSNGSMWISAAAWVKPEGTYRVGAVLKDPQAKVSFHFSARPGKDGKVAAPVICELAFDGSTRSEQTLTLDSERSSVVVQVRSSRPLVEAIDKVWVVPGIAR